MKKMKSIIIVGVIVITMSSCATTLGGEVTAHQKIIPKAGEEQREVRVVALIADVIIFWPLAIVDFATGAIYKPEKIIIEQ
jgi:hypothetical protein